MRLRSYVHATDFDPVNRLLLEAYRPGDACCSWLQPRWEYQHFHPLIRDLDRSLFGVAEADHGHVLGIVHNEHDPAVAYLQRRPGDRQVIEPLLDWAEEHLGGWSRPSARQGSTSTPSGRHDPDEAGQNLPPPVDTFATSRSRASRWRPMTT